ncbi:MAG: efflux RND transporter periplasmic adaptor subunit [Synergistaceae bacterium]|jgi:RND family efflux transporter MFP subunit|nr:efflux RND transporter periplasmic adaptor subunit [Synergistaceae bacterium]
MKKSFALSFAVIILISASFIAYGIYLNKMSDSYIDTMMAARAVMVKGMKVSYREIYPEIIIPSAGFQAGKTADVVAQISGTIVRFFVNPGQTVKKGQRICSVTNHEISLQIARADTDIAKAEAAYHQVSGEHMRNQRLADKNAIAKSELEASSARQKAAKAELEAARIQRRQLDEQSKRQDILSPLEGYAAVVYQQVGAYVSAGSPILMIGDFNQLVFTLMMQDHLIKNIAPIDDSYSMLLNTDYLIAKGLNITFKSGFEESFTINTKIQSIAPPLSEQAPLRVVTMELDNNLALLEPGLYTDILIQKKKLIKILAMPAILSADDKDHEVYVLDADSKLALRKIKTGLYNSEFIEVTEGLSDGDVVITSGIEGIELGSRLDVVMEER